MLFAFQAIALNALANLYHSLGKRDNAAYYHAKNLQRLDSEQVRVAFRVQGSLNN